MSDGNDLSVGERMQNAKTAYDVATDEHAEAECDLCEKVKEDVRMWDVQNEATGAKKTVDLCPDCRDLTERYNRGEDVEWPEAAGK